MLAMLKDMTRRLLIDEDGQTATEYMLGIAVVAVGISIAFIYMSDSTKTIFNNARRMIELPYP